MRKNVIPHFVLVLLFMSILHSCKKDNLNNSPNTSENDFITIPDAGYFNHDYEPNGVTDRITLTNETLIWKNDLRTDSVASGNHASTRTGNNYSDIFWIHTGELEPFLHQSSGEILSATHIAYKNNVAVVGYHKRGNLAIGAIEILDMTNPEDPIVTFWGEFDNADVNGVEIGGNPGDDEWKIWLALSDKNKGAVLAELDMQGAGTLANLSILNLNHYTTTGISAAANSVTLADNYLYISSGASHGGVYCIDPNTLEVLGNAEFQNAKYILENGKDGTSTKIVSLQTGSEASFRVEDVGSFHFSNQHDVGSILHQSVGEVTRGKSAMHFLNNNPNDVFIAMGENGLKSFDINTGQETWSSPESMITDGNTNSLTSDDKFIYVANGADGLSVFTNPTYYDHEPEVVFHWDMEEGEASANFVETGGDWVFIAKGQGGVKILKRPEPGDYLTISPYDVYGVPDYLADNIDICETLLDNIFNNVLQETQDATIAHPDFFTDDVVRNIYLKEKADVYVSFVHEGAGYKNVLGYYYYHVDHPPTSVDDIAKLIVFPNASAVGSGGGLSAGNTVKLIGTFDENTVIGFFLNANGWDGTKVTQGIWGHYTNDEFNHNGLQHVLMHDVACDATVVCFDDQVAGDKDYNDAIFQVKTDPPAAMDVSEFIQF